MRLLLLCSLALVSSTATWSAEPVPFDSPRWQFDAKTSRLEKHLGRDSLFLDGGSALVADAEMLDGAIEFDVAFGPERGFIGAVWRVQDEGNYEQFYIRPHQSGNPDANQYTPAFNGLTGWQLYHGEGYGAPVEYRFHTWTPVRIVVSGDEAEVFIGDLEHPALFIDDLKHEARPGRVGLTVADFAPAHFSNFRFSPADRPVLQGRVPRRRGSPAGAIMAWSVSTPFAESAIQGALSLAPEFTADMRWTELACEPTGLANLSQVHPRTRERDTVLARTTIRSETAATAGLAFGYSDRARVFLNGHLLYSGDNGYRSRDYRYLGTIGYFDRVYLPLDKGDNTLVFAVSESFGGWGLQAALDETTGLSVQE